MYLDLERGSQAGGASEVLQVTRSHFSFLHFKSRIWCGKVEGIGISRVCGSAAQNLREDRRQGPHGIEDLSALLQMGKWSRKWSPCDPAQCWVKLWLIWCSCGIKNQLASKFDCKSSYLQSKVEFAEWASWKDAGTPTSTINQVAVEGVNQTAKTSNQLSMGRSRGSWPVFRLNVQEAGSRGRLPEPVWVVQAWRELTTHLGTNWSKFSRRLDPTEGTYDGLMRARRLKIITT